MAKYTFHGIVFDDVALKDNDGYKDWSQVCHACVKEHRLHASKDARLADIPVAGLTCGIVGCTNEAEFYIDFADGVLVPTDFEDRYKQPASREQKQNPEQSRTDTHER